MGVDTLPRQITARGGRMLLKGHVSEYPDNMNVTYEYPDGRLLIYENYPFTAYGLHGFDNGNVFYGTEGYMIFSRRGAFQVFLGPKNRKGPTEGQDLRGQRGYAEHMSDFLNAVRSRNQDTAARPELAHLSCALVHLGEIAYRTEGRLEFNPKTPPSTNELEQILDKLGIEPRELMRKGEALYKELGLGSRELSRAEAIQLLHENPKLIERPIVVRGDRAVLGRPPENVQELL